MTYREINFRVMTDTVEQCEKQPALKYAIENSRAKQYVIKEGTDIEIPDRPAMETKIILSGKRTFEAASGYPGQEGSCAQLRQQSRHWRCTLQCRRTRGITLSLLNALPLSASLLRDLLQASYRSLP